MTTSTILVEDEGIALRPMREDDLASLLLWRRAPHVRATWDNDDDGGVIDASIIDVHYRRARSVDPDRRRDVGLDVFVGDARFLGRGVGSRAVDLACRWMFDRGASSVALLTAKDDARARRAYEKAGFVCRGEALDTDTRGGVRIASWLMIRAQAASSARSV